MTIERMTKLSIVCLKREEERLRSFLMERGVLHINNIRESLAQGEKSENNYQERIPIVDTAEIDQTIVQLGSILEFFNRFSPEAKGLIDLFTTPTLFVNQTVIDEAKRLNIQELLKEIKELDKIYYETTQKENDIIRELKEIEPYSALPFRPADIRETKRTFSLVGKIQQIDYPAFLQKADSLLEYLHIESLTEDSRYILILLIGLKDKKEEITALLSSFAFIPLSLPRISIPVNQYMQQQKEELHSLQVKKTDILRTIQELVQMRLKIKILLEEYKKKKSFQEVKKYFLETKWTVILEGYLLTHKVEELEQSLSEHFKGISHTFSEPEATESIPISLKNNKLFQPLEFLVQMFGYPNYSALDPTPFIFITFLSFFGICFGDVLYGGMLVGLTVWLMKKYPREKNFINFMKLLFYAGVSTIFFGLITGSWGGDLVSSQYLSASNPLVIVRDSLILIDPLNKPLAMLVITLFIGVCNQFYGIFLKALTEIRRGNIKNALFDGFLWYPYLIGAMLLISTLFVKIPPIIYKTGFVLFFSGALGLVLTQGRGEESLVGKILTGVVSLYGILGSYGLAGFVGDTLSYSRLLALGLTTSIIGMAFNIIAFLFKVPVIWPVMLAVILIVGHIFNFLMSIIGSFIHPTRLIFLEFFGRFYESGGTPFKPFSNKHSGYEIINEG